MKQFIASVDVNYNAGRINAAVDGNTIVNGANSLNYIDTATGLAVGSIAVFGTSTTGFDMGVALTTGTGISTLIAAGVDSFKLGVGRTANGAFITQDIDIATLTVESAVYAAATSHIETIDIATYFVGPALASDIGKEFTIVINDSQKLPQDPMRRKRYTWTIAAVGETNITIAANLSAAITAMPGDVILTATSAGVSVITITSIVGLQFTAFGRAELEQATFTVTLIGSIGNGTYAQMLAFETEASTERGKRSFNYLVNELYSVPSMLNPTSTYDVILLTWKQKDSDALSIKTQNPRQQLVIATDRTTNQTVYNTLLAILTT